MPTYNFRNKETGEEIEKFMKIGELDKFKKENPNLEQFLTGAPSTIHERGTNLKVDNGFREVMSKVKEKHRINNIKDY